MLIPYIKRGTLELREINKRDRCTFGSANRPVVLDFIKDKEGKSIIGFLADNAPTGEIASSLHYGIVYRPENLEPIICSVTNMGTKLDEGIILFSVPLNGKLYYMTIDNLMITKVSQDIDTVSMALHYIILKEANETKKEYKITLYTYNKKKESAPYRVDEYTFDPSTGAIRSNCSEFTSPPDVPKDIVTNKIFRIKRYIPRRSSNNIILPNESCVSDGIADKICGRYFLNKKFVNVLCVEQADYAEALENWITKKHISAISVYVPGKELTEGFKLKVNLDKLAEKFNIVILVFDDFSVKQYRK